MIKKYNQPNKGRNGIYLSYNNDKGRIRLIKSNFLKWQKLLKNILMMN